jgi:serine/threonine protein kinase/WD40 repeat protein/Tfp pilus assembly protein PilF
MPLSNSSRDALLERLAEEFVERHRRGERPPLSEYTDGHPDLAAEIRDLFPALVQIERLKPAAGDLTGAFVPESGPASDPTPERLGEYRILRQVGCGGMGVVYEAEQETLGRRVALKVLPRQALLRPTYLERFRREAKAAGRLHHTNIVPVFGVGECDGTHFYVMQFIRGEGLDRVLRDLRRLRAVPGSPTATGQPFEGSVAHSLLTGRFAAAPATPADDSGTRPAPLTDEETPSSSSLSASSPEGHYFRGIARVAVQVADALAYAHRQRILHRDIKPSNLLLDQQGTVWVTDFGLAKAEGTDDITQTGDIVGTVRYMAPERFDGQSLPQSDVYALGVTLYELLTLRSAFDDTNRARLVEKVLHEPPVSPRKLDTHIPRDLETIVLKAMAKEPAQRYQTAQEMGDDLRRFLNGEPIKARRTSLLGRARLWSRRHPALAGLYVVLFVAALGFAVTAVYLNTLLRQKDRAEQQAIQELFASYVAQANASRFSQQPGQRFDTLDAIEKAVLIARERAMAPAQIDRLRNLAIAALALPDLRVLDEWQLFGEESTGAWSSDAANRLLAVTLKGGWIVVYRTEDRTEIARLPGQGLPYVGFSKDGRFLVNCDGQRFQVWDLDGAEPHAVFPDLEQGRTLWHPDSRHLVVCRPDGSIALHDLSRGESVRTLTGPTEGKVVPWSFDSQGRMLALTIGLRAFLLDMRTATARPLPHSGACRDVACHPSGRYVALAIEPRTIEVWDVERSQRVSEVEGSTSGAVGLTFTPDGELLLSWSWDGKLRFWNFRTARQVLEYPRGQTCAFGRDGHCIFTNGTRLVLAEIATGREYRTLVQSSGRKDVRYIWSAVHPDGRLLAVQTSDGLGFWDLDSGAEVAALEGVPVNAHAFASSQELLINSPFGLFSLPVRQAAPGMPHYRLGPPARLHPGANAAFGCSKDGRIITQGNFPNDGATLILREDGSRTVHSLGPHAAVGGTGVSPDGRFVATYSHSDRESTRIWSTADRHLVATLDTGGGVRGDFSPDNKWFAVHGAKCGRLIAVGEWQSGGAVQWNGGVAFSPASDLLAVERGHGVIDFLDPETGTERARFEDPSHDKADGLAFTPDGGRLVTTSPDGKAIHVWDLRLIRRQLASWGLDWDAASLPPAQPAATDPLQVQIDAGDLGQAGRAVQLVQQAGRQVHANEAEKALASLREAVRIAPTLAAARNNLAWLLVTGPAKLRDAREGLAHARKAVELTADHKTDYLNTLGVALYRNGRFAEAVPVLEKSLQALDGQADAFDLFFLAMCHHQLGETKKAHEEYERAVRWFKEHRDKLPDPGWSHELTEFQAEAEALLKQPPPRRPEGGR